MTIYILDQDFQKSAQMLDDFNLQEVIKEIASTLLNVNPYFKLSTTWPRVPDKPPEEYNEWEKWASQSKNNYNTLLEYGNELKSEHRYRFYQPCRCNMECNYDKPNGYYEIEECEDHLPNFAEATITHPWHKTIPVTIPGEYMIYQTKSYTDFTATPNTTESYKNYYCFEVTENTGYEWTKRERPILNLR